MYYVISLHVTGCPIKSVIKQCSSNLVPFDVQDFFDVNFKMFYTVCSFGSVNFSLPSTCSLIGPGMFEHLIVMASLESAMSERMLPAICALSENHVRSIFTSRNVYFFDKNDLKN